MRDPALGHLLALDMVALDPSVRSAGVAIFRAGVLTDATTIKMKPTEDEYPPARCLRMANDIVDWVVDRNARPRVLAVEWPGKSWRGDARDLHGLAGVAGAVAGMLSLASIANGSALSCISAEAPEWTGGLPKSTTSKGYSTSARALRICSKLTNREMLVWETLTSHDVIDAIGLGLWVLGRFDVKHIYPGAS